MSSIPPQSHSRRPSLPMIPIPLNTQVPGTARGPPLTPIGYARNGQSRRSSVSTSLPSSATSIANSFPFRRGSISSVSSTASGLGSRDNEDAIAEDDDVFTFGNGNAGGKKEEGLSFARRMSFGARALGGVVNRGPASPVATVGKGFFPDPESRNPALKDHLDGQRRRGMSLGAAQAPPSNLRAADAAVQGKVKPSLTDRAIDPFEERLHRGEMYMD